ncbi:TIM barrel protein [Vibrio hannami]|uniref:sugar phosphate isomerase/epimerase family protein n=1 Tax=Vibrio hannami TaxID=2717094 RepID=UPI002410AADA|nr:TIM barrel protein [Vibrio hannami]MDG3087882.1 TIM barrel protein [Vibrio hannami]
MKDNFSISTVAYSGYPIDQALDSISSLGVKNIELALIQGAVHGLDEDGISEEYVRYIRRLLLERGMRCTSLAAHCDMNLDNCESLLLKRVQLTNMLDCPRLILYAPRDCNLSDFQSKAQSAIRAAEGFSIQILIENVGDQKPYMLNDSDDFEVVKGECKSAALGINFDPGNLASHRPENDLLFDSIRSLKSAEHIHIKDLHLDGEDYHFCAIGEGICEYPALFEYALINNEMPFFSIEAPFSLIRKRDGSAVLKPVSEVPSLAEIEDKLGRSVQVIEECFSF